MSDPASGMFRVRNLYLDPKTGKLIVEYEQPRGGGEVAIQSMQLDPNAQAYTDDQIVGKVNAASANITRAGAVEAAARPIAAGEVGATELADEPYTTAEQTKLAGVEDGAAADQTGAEVRDLIVALADVDRKIVITDPQSGEFKVVAVQRQAGGKLDVDYDDVAV